MKVFAVRSDGIESKIMRAPPDKKNGIYRYEQRMPFERKWACNHVTMKAKTPDDYDVIMASGLLGHIAPAKEDETQKRSFRCCGGLLE